MKQLIIFPFLLLYINSLAATKISTPPAKDVTLQVILTKLDGTIIKATIISYNLDKIIISPGTIKGIKKGNIYFPEVIPYSQIKSIKVLQKNWLLLVASAGLLFIFLLLIKANLNSLPEDMSCIILAPLMFITGFIGLLRKKKFNLNGNKEKYMYFLSRLKKFW